VRYRRRVEVGVRRRGVLPLGSPGPDLVGRSAAPPSLLGLREATVFFLIFLDSGVARWCRGPDLLLLRQDIICRRSDLVRRGDAPPLLLGV
jgi:hypothetical protein